MKKDRWRLQSRTTDVKRLLGVIIRRKRSDEKFRHIRVAHLQDILILGHEIVAEMRVWEVWRRHPLIFTKQSLQSFEEYKYMA